MAYLLSSHGNGARSTSYTSWPYEFIQKCQSVTPQMLLTNIKVQKELSQDSLDRRLSACFVQATRRKNKPKKGSCCILPNRNYMNESPPMHSYMKKRRKKHKTTRVDPYHVRDIDDMENLVAAFSSEQAEGDALHESDLPCGELSQQPSPVEGQQVDKGVTGKELRGGKESSVDGQREIQPEEQERKRAGQFTVYIRQLDNKVVGVPLHPRDTLAQLRTVIKCHAAKLKFYCCGKQLRERLPLSEQNIVDGSNIDMHVGLQGGADKNPDSKAEGHKLSDNMEEWSEDDVKVWLEKDVKLEDVYVQKIMDEEINGYNVKNLFTLGYLLDTIQMKTGPALKLLGKRDAFLAKTVHQEDKVELMSVEEVSVWLKNTVKLKEQYLLKLREEKFDGWNLKYSLDEEYLKKIIGMKSGPINSLLGKVKEFLSEGKPTQETSTSDSSQQVVRPKEAQGPDTSKPQTSKQSTKNQSPAKLPASSQMKEYQKMLEECICLKTKADDPELGRCEPATLELINAKWGKKQNMMDAHFCFLLLTKGDNQLKNRDSEMWAKICEHLKKWVKLLDPTEQAKYEAVSGSNKTMKVKGTTNVVQLSQKAKCGPINRRPANEFRNHTKIVLLVDKEMLTSQKTRYQIFLDETKRRGLTFDFNTDHYWVASFRPNDLTVPFAFNKSDLSSESFKHLTLSDSESEEESEASAASTKLRPFGQTKPHSYPHRRVVDEIETGVTDLLNPAHEFKFSIKQGNDLVHYFIEETMRFSCACLNVRSNGTIHFGIADDKSGEYRSGEVLGLAVEDTEKAKFEEALTSFKRSKGCFPQKSQREAVQTCIKPPVFVKVSGTKECRYVIEVEVEPKAVDCKNLAFKVCLPKSMKERKKQAFDDPKYYERKGSSSCIVEDDDLADGTFLERVHQAKIQREKEETKAMAALITKPQSTRFLAERLQSLFCLGRPKQMSSFYHVLVTTTPPPDLIGSGHLSFVTCIDWVAVFDFDPDSYETGLAKLYKDKGISEYLPEEFSTKYQSLVDLKDFCNEIKFRNLPLWLSCNGRNDLAHIGSMKSSCSGEELETRQFDVKEWKRKRRTGIKDAISFLSREDIIPDQSKVVITFLLFSEDYEIVADTFINYFAIDFKIGQLLYIGESDTMLHGWYTKLEEVFAKEEHKIRGIVGMPWSHVNESIKRFVGAVEEGEGMLPSSTGGSVVLKERDRKLWKYLDVVCANQCENSDMLKDPEALESHRQEKEEEFWKGKKVDWWNFWLTENHRAGVNGQVLTRDGLKKLKDIVRSNLKGEIEGEGRTVNTVQLFHHPGAGGSTMARHVLWDFRADYRCAVVKSATQEACEQIIDLYTHKEPDSANRQPVLILVEDIDEEQLRLFKQEIESVINRRLEEVRKSTPVCVLLHCMRSASAQDLKRRNFTSSVVLEQSLSQREMNWCNQQLGTYLKHRPEQDPRQFLAFMILKENFDSRYVKETVRGILSEVDMAKSEKSVLKYVSLLSKFVKDAGIPVSRCKPVLGINPKNPHADQIEDLLSESSGLLLVECSKEEDIGTVKCYSTVHPLVAEQILDQLLLKDNQTYGEITLDFINSHIFMDYKFAREYIVRVTGQMLKKRQHHDDGTKGKFSPLILHICDIEDNVKMALEVMTCAYDRLQDGILAQQAARLYYIKDKNFKDARTYAQKAKVDLRNSYTLDTVAQVEKEDFNYRYQSHIEKQSTFSPDSKDIIEAIELAFKAMSHFRNAQKANIDEGARNLAGFVGEVQVCFQLLKLLQCIPLFKGEEGRECLRDYLMRNSPLPSFVKDCWNEYHSEFEQLQDRIDKALEYIANLKTLYKHDVLNASKAPLGRSSTAVSSDVYDDDDDAYESTKFFLETNYRNYALYFCVPSEKILDDISDGAWKCELRRSQVAALGGKNYYTIFQHVTRKGIPQKVENLLKIRDMLKANIESPQHRKPSDIQNYILANLALASVDYVTGMPPLHTLCELSEKLVDRSDGQEAYPYFLLYMLMWPHKDMRVRYDHIKFKGALKMLSELDRKNCRPRREQQKPYDKIQGTEYQPRVSTLFFLGKTIGTLKQITHIAQLPPFNVSKHRMPIIRGLQSSIRRDKFWQNSAIPKTLYRLRGTEYGGIIYMKNVKYTGTNEREKNIEVRPAMPTRRGSGHEEVSFYLGFSWAGPVAYDVQKISDESGTTPLCEGTMPAVVEADEMDEPMPEEETQFDYPQFQADMEKLQSDLKKIHTLKQQRDKGQSLDKTQEDMVASEGDILKKMGELTQQCRKHLNNQNESD